jgi:energy-coupling factor transport system ATP-binding protein
LENLQLDHQEIEERINDALKRFELEDFKDRNLQELSGGEQQRIALALVYSLKSSVILLDEPFANVDPENRRKLLEDLKRLQKEQRKTILISDHDSSGYFGIVDHWYRFSSQGFVEKDVNELKTREQQPKVIGVPKNDARLFWDDLGFEVSKRKLLSNSSFCLPTGQIGLLSGKNGCGKSTLFACLCKLHEKTGKITFDQKDSDKIKLSKWAKNVGYAFQNSLDQFIKLTVEEEILASRKNTRHKDYWSEERIQRAIKALNLTGVMKHSVYQISGGQQKKLQLLVMMIMAQPILLIDEPFAGLDQASLEVSCSLLKETVKNLQLSVLLISHQRVRVVSFMDYEISLKDGNLKEVSA